MGQTATPETGTFWSLWKSDAGLKTVDKSLLLEFHQGYSWTWIRNYPWDLHKKIHGKERPWNKLGLNMHFYQRRMAGCCKAVLSLLQFSPCPVRKRQMGNISLSKLQRTVDPCIITTRVSTFFSIVMHVLVDANHWMFFWVDVRGNGSATYIVQSLVFLWHQLL